MVAKVLLVALLCHGILAVDLPSRTGAGSRFRSLKKQHQTTTAHVATTAHVGSFKRPDVGLELEYGGDGGSASSNLILAKLDVTGNNKLLAPVLYSEHLWDSVGVGNVGEPLIALTFDGTHVSMYPTDVDEETYKEGWYADWGWAKCTAPNTPPGCGWPDAETVGNHGYLEIATDPIDVSDEAKHVRLQKALKAWAKAMVDASTNLGGCTDLPGFTGKKVVLLSTVVTAYNTAIGVLKTGDGNNVAWDEFKMKGSAVTPETSLNTRAGYSWYLDCNELRPALAPSVQANFGFPLANLAKIPKPPPPNGQVDFRNPYVAQKDLVNANLMPQQGLQLFVGCRALAKAFFADRTKFNNVDMARNWNARAIMMDWCRFVGVESVQETPSQTSTVIGTFSSKRGWGASDYKMKFGLLNKCSPRDTLHIALSGGDQAAIVHRFSQDKDTLVNEIYGLFGTHEVFKGWTTPDETTLKDNIAHYMKMFKPKAGIARYPADTDTVFGATVDGTKDDVPAPGFLTGTGKPLKPKDLTGGNTQIGVVLEARSGTINGLFKPNGANAMSAKNPKGGLDKLKEVQADMTDANCD